MVQRPAASRLRRFLLLSLLIHLLGLWLLRFLPAAPPQALAPVAIRVLDAPLAPPPAARPPAPPPEKAPKPPPPKPSPRGGLVVDLPKPVEEAPPEAARIVSRYDSRAQDPGPGEAGARKPSGAKPPPLPAELNLPERYGGRQTAPAAAAPARQSAREKATPSEARPPAQHAPAPQPEAPRFRITAQQEVAMLRRPPEAPAEAKSRAFEEHLAALEKRLPLPTFEAPGVYAQGPERPGEGQDERGGGKYRSIDAFGLKHVSYLLQVQRQIELVFSVPFFVPTHGAIGVPIVGFTIRRSGELAEAVLLRSSGYAVLDNALLEAVKRAAPFRPFPEYLPEQELSIRVFATIS
ncbi:MAG: hypothetical protein KatS3mg131_1930 [Candidatus Tectimicrobiota bacterium]|nr:MAG: hypothetical protein KatS3mg131_1930 [Candidatus Tectomicrobia bacterium]